MPKKEVVVESFELDHTIVKAPYVRLISEESGPSGDIITNFDIRLVQPNENAIPTAGLHTIEHLLAKLIRERISGMIDCSPFGCRTGFHLIMWGKHDTTELANNRMKKEELGWLDELRIWVGVLLKELWSILKSMFWVGLIVGWLLWMSYWLASGLFEQLLVWIKR